MRMPVRISVVLSAMLVTALAGCGDGDGGTGTGTPVTPEQIRSFYETQAPVIRAGILDGVSRVVELTNGGVPAGVTLMPAGGSTAPTATKATSK